MEHFPKPIMNGLPRVISVAQRQTIGGGTITVLSAELYEDAVRLVFRFQGLAHQERLVFPWRAAVVAGDRQVELQNDGMTHGHGMRNPDGTWTWWIDVVFCPALPPDTRRLELALPSVQKPCVDETVAKPVWSVADLLPGPWEFVIHIPDADGDA
jgi:hypothetical protein